METGNLTTVEKKSKKKNIIVPTIILTNNKTNVDTVTVCFIFLYDFFFIYSGTNLDDAKGRPRLKDVDIIVERVIVVIAIPYCSCVKNLLAINQKMNEVKVNTNQLENR
jgi:hypothetical protein